MPKPECTEIAALLSDYLDRDLPPDTCAVVQAHLDSCSACSNAAESLRATVNLCRQYRSEHHLGPVPDENRQQLKRLFEQALSNMRGR